MNEAGKDAENGKARKVSGNSMTILCYRWLFSVFACLFYIFIPAKSHNISVLMFLETFAILAAYNVLVTVYIIKRRKDSERISTLIMLMDMFFVAVFSCLLGGLDSDAYIFFFFIIGYGDLFGNVANTMETGLFAAAVYSISCAYASKIHAEDINYVRLIIKDLLLIMWAYFIYKVNYEVKKYDKLHKKEFKLARTDSLTGLANRYYFEQKLLEETEYADMTGNPLNILMFDLDNFKLFNDTYGHMLGDKLLALFSDIILQSIRKEDIPIRYGGEEFLILIRDLDLNIVKNIADRIIRQLEKQRIYTGNPEDRKRVTASCGIAQYPRHSKDIREVVVCADKALYQAKALGKNNVVVYDESCKKGETLV